MVFSLALVFFPARAAVSQTRFAEVPALVLSAAPRAIAESRTARLPAAPALRVVAPARFASGQSSNTGVWRNAPMPRDSTSDLLTSVLLLGWVDIRENGEPFGYARTDRYRSYNSSCAAPGDYSGPEITAAVVDAGAATLEVSWP